jgi:hypothetical protein
LFSRELKWSPILCKAFAKKNYCAHKLCKTPYSLGEIIARGSKLFVTNKLFRV